MITRTQEHFPVVGGPSPWGTIQKVYEVNPRAGGLYSVVTAGHGGLFVSAFWRAKMPAALRTPSRFYPLQDGPAWFEEDLEALRVVISFPSLFPGINATEAAGILRSVHPVCFPEVKAVE